MLRLYGYDPDEILAEISHAKTERERINAEFESVIKLGYREVWT